MGCNTWIDSIGENSAVKEVKRNLSLDGTETIKINVVDPQSSGIANVHSLAVVDFLCEEPLAELLSSALSARLSASGRLELKDRPTVMQACYEGAPAAREAITAARAATLGKRIGAGAVLVGEVVSLSTSDSNTAAKPTTSTFSLDKLTSTLNQNLRTQAANLVADYRLIDSGSGRLLLTRRAQASVATHSLTALNAVDPAATAKDVLVRLADRCAELITAELSSPGQRGVERRFALGHGKVYRGNTYARQGVLDYARQMYQEAIQEKNEDHAAHYNLGLLQEASGDLASAQASFQKAMQLRECELYMGAFQRARAAAGGAAQTPTS